MPAPFLATKLFISTQQVPFFPCSTRRQEASGASLVSWSGPTISGFSFLFGHPAAPGPIASPTGVIGQNSGVDAPRGVAGPKVKAARVLIDERRNIGSFRRSGRRLTSRLIRPQQSASSSRWSRSLRRALHHSLRPPPLLPRSVAARRGRGTMESINL